jgi:uncharacterized protein
MHSRWSARQPPRLAATKQTELLLAWCGAQTVMPDNPGPEGDVMAAKFEIGKDHAGKFRFHLKAPNGEIIAASQGYETKANAEKGIEAIKTHAPGAKVEDHSDM